VKVNGGVEVKLHAFLTSTLDGGEWSASCPSCFTHREMGPGTNWIGGLVSPRASVDMTAKRKNPFIAGDGKRMLVFQPAA